MGGGGGGGGGGGAGGRSPENFFFGLKKWGRGKKGGAPWASLRSATEVVKGYKNTMNKLFDL